MAHRLCLVVLFAFAADAPGVQALTCSLVNVAVLVLHVSARPLRDPTTHWLQVPPAQCLAGALRSLAYRSLYGSDVNGAVCRLPFVVVMSRTQCLAGALRSVAYRSLSGDDVNGALYLCLPFMVMTSRTQCICAGGFLVSTSAVL